MTPRERKTLVAIASACNGALAAIGVVAALAFAGVIDDADAEAARAHQRAAPQQMANTDRSGE